ncbi:MAG: MarR family winged helix-turn-helix transcriptional regulator [Novosphingobium sp.]
MQRDSRRQLIGLIYRVHGNLRSLFSGPVAGADLALLEALALATIDATPQPLTVSQIGRELGFLRQSVQRAVSKLVELGLVEAQPNAAHKSAPVFVITDAGRQRMLSIETPAQELADSLAGIFDDARAAALCRELSDLRKAINERIGK